MNFRFVTTFIIYIVIEVYFLSQNDNNMTVVVCFVYCIFHKFKLTFNQADEIWEFSTGEFFGLRKVEQYFFKRQCGTPIYYSLSNFEIYLILEDFKIVNHC